MNWAKKLRDFCSASVYMHKWRAHVETPIQNTQNPTKQIIILNRSFVYLCALVVYTGGGVWYLWHTDQYFGHDGLFHIVFLDVGQGTGVYMKTPAGTELLYDIGPRSQSLRSLEQFRPWYDRSIDYLIGSHADSDHVGMVPHMIDAYQVGQIVLGPGTRDTKLYDRIQQGEQYQNNLYWSQGDARVIDADTYVRVLHPQTGTVTSANDDSLVMMVHMGDLRLLLTGDISKTVERKLVAQYGQHLDSDILLVSHHGSQTSSDYDFIQTVSPSVAVVSAGEDNRYGHPHQSVVRVFNQLGVPLLRTDEIGSIHIIFDGDHLLLQ